MTTSNSYLASFFHLFVCLFVLFLWENFTAIRCKLLEFLLVELKKVKVKVADEKTCVYVYIEVHSGQTSEICKS